MGFEGGNEKNLAFKGKGVKGKGVKGKGESTKNPSNFAVRAFVMMQTAYQNAKNQRF